MYSEIIGGLRSLPGFPVTDFHPERKPCTVTAAVPFGNHTRLSILPRLLNRSREHLRLLIPIVHKDGIFVNRSHLTKR